MIQKLSYVYIICIILFLQTRASGLDHHLNIIQLCPSYEVNIESCQPESGRFSKSFSPRENKLQSVDYLMFPSYEGNTCFIIPKLLLRCLKLECFVLEKTTTKIPV